MNSTDPIPLNIFYSWQSDSPSTTNLNLIRDAIRTAASRIEKDLEGSRLAIKLDEATRGVPGSPNIPDTILEKIRGSQIFICDVTTINPEAPDTQRKVPNPNVLIELGYAIAELGWNRIIMLFNKAFGEMADAPFDIDRHRLSGYHCSSEQITSKQPQPKKDLEGLLHAAISLIINKNPPTPRELGLSPDEIKRNRDERTLRELFLEVSIPTLEDFLHRAPHIIPGPLFHFWEGFHGLVASHQFHLYDKTLFSLITEMHSAWHEALSHDSEYQPSNTGNFYIFSNPMDMPLPRDRKEIWDSIVSALRRLNTALKQILTHMRENYVTIDIDQLSNQAWKDYVAFQRKASAEIDG
jgi:hypothetical protein